MSPTIVDPEDIERLYYASGSDHHYHLNEDCRYVQFSENVNDCHVTNRMPGKLCSECSPEDLTIDDLPRRTVDDHDLATDGGTTTRVVDVDETHIDPEDGLWIPPALREFTRQIVFKTPSGTIQHFSQNQLDPYYGMVTSGDFGEPDSFEDCRHPQLAPTQVSIKPQGEDAVVLDVDTDPDVACDRRGGDPA